MKAIRVHQLGGPEVLRLEDLPDPHPGPGQLTVMVRAIGVNPTDVYLRSGMKAGAELPYTPGDDAAGVVAEVGEGVNNLRTGDRVYTSGTLSGAYAEIVLCDASTVFSLPGSVSFSQGAAIGIPYGTAYHALFQRAKAISGEVVFIHGASGGVGLAAVQLARAERLIIIGTAGSEAGRELVRQEGARHVLDHHSSDYLQQVLTITNGRGVDIILEMLANVNLGKDLSILARHGRILVVGSRGQVEINPRDLMSREADIRGVMLSHVFPQEMASTHQTLHAGLEQGVLRPIIGEELPLSQASQAHVRIMEPGAQGKIILIP